MSAISTLTAGAHMEKSTQVMAAPVTETPPTQSIRAPSPAPHRAHLGHSQSYNATTTSLQDESLTRPVDLEHHSKLPYFLRLNGSITPKMMVPLAFIAAWATMITVISKYVYPLVVNDLLLTVLGFVVGLGISFRTSSAYERYVDGRRYWMQLSQSSRDLARHIWIHVQERHSTDPAVGKDDLLGKIGALNLVTAFAQALKHHLRFEPYTHYPDLGPLVSHLDTFAGAASGSEAPLVTKASFRKRAGNYLGLTFAESNPRKLIKRSNRPLGNLPLEILTYLSSYHESRIRAGTIDGTHQAMIASNLMTMNEVLAGTERVLNTPLPAAYSIAISQITWVYVLVLPFQLFDALKWLTVPGTVLGAYIILGIAAIGREIENPFGFDDNDLPLNTFCDQIAREIDVIRSKPRQDTATNFFRSEANTLLFNGTWPNWETKSVEEIRSGLAAKAEQIAKPVKKERSWKVKLPHGDA